MAGCYKDAQARGLFGKWEVETPWKRKCEREGEKTNSSSDPREKENLTEGGTNGAQTLQHIIIITTYTVSLTHPYGWKELLLSNTRQLGKMEVSSLYSSFNNEH